MPVKTSVTLQIHQIYFFSYYDDEKNIIQMLSLSKNVCTFEHKSNYQHTGLGEDGQ